MRNPERNNVIPRALIRSKSLLLCALGLIVLLPACYTLLKHPTVLDEDQVKSDVHRCNECHSESDLWGYSHGRVRFYGGIGYYDPWIYYYDTPWWYDSFWYYHEERSPQTVPLHRRSIRPGRAKEKSSIIRGKYIIPPAEKGTLNGNSKVKIKNSKDEGKHEKIEKKTERRKSIKPSRKKKKKKD